jgi:hypothetical protein
MLRKVLPLAAFIVGLAALGPMAQAADFFAFGRHDDDSMRIWKPYVIEKNCVEGFHHCKVRMDYDPLQRPMVVRPGSYWYQKPFEIYRYGDFKGHPHHAHWHYKHHHHRHHRHAYRLHLHGSKHVAWCSAHYRSYDPATDTFLGKGHKRYRCDSPYDGR